MAASFGACLRFLGKRKPDVVLGMGGYVTVPGGLMARLRGIPLALVNADAALLLSNKTLAPMAQRVLFGFPADFGSAAGKAVVTGNPVRQEILDLPPPRAALRRPQRPAARAGGRRQPGRQGAQRQRAGRAGPDRRNVRPIVTHQSGKKNIDALRAAYAQAGVEANVVDFIDDMAPPTPQADLVICRAGAITVSELTAAGVASVLVPFVASTTSHQRDNAVWMARRARRSTCRRANCRPSLAAAAAVDHARATAWRWRRRRGRGQARRERGNCGRTRTTGEE
jgi:UDP-N-acetylglucosamine--N-acetylmuramyl-(pentapeptide) pyrophosphoryl-undecaprenol N-acetylglucosamine transferase